MLLWISLVKLILLFLMVYIIFFFWWNFVLMGFLLVGIMGMVDFVYVIEDFYDVYFNFNVKGVFFLV